MPELNIQELKEIFKVIDLMFSNCNLDYIELQKLQINEQFFEDHLRVRIVNSFLFSFFKLQDKIEAKLLKKILYLKKETDLESISMIDAINLLEKLDVIKDYRDWERLREIRNSHVHEYPTHIQDRIESIHLALEGYGILENIYSRLKDYALES
jgi:hypothetical protein